MTQLSLRLALALTVSGFALSVPVLAQPIPGPTLPDPAVGPNAGPRALLHDALGALATGRVGEAQEAMERAQTRLLDRSVPMGTTGIPSNQPAVKLISQGLQALAAHDRAGAAHAVRAALQTLGER